MCPKVLPVPDTTSFQWNAMTVEQQEQVRAMVLGSWARIYFACADRHNRLILEIEK